MSIVEELHALFDALFEPTDKVEFRFLPPMKTKSNQWFDFPGALINDFGQVAERNKRQDVYFGVNPRQGNGGRAGDVEVCRCVFADFDHTTPDTALDTITQAGLPEPTVLINSGHGAHTYWRLEEEVDIPQWRAIQRGLIELLKCDDKIHDPPRIMRLPGTKHVGKHVKGSEPKYCTIVFNRGTRHDVEDIVMRLPVVADAEYGDTPALPEGHRDPLPAWANKFLISGTAGGNRNSTCFDVACCMKGAGWPVEEARALIVAAADRCDPPLPQGEALAAVKSAYAQERSPATPDPDTLPLGSAWQIAAVPPFMEPDEPDDDNHGQEWVQVGEPSKAAGAARGLLSNVVESVDREGNTITHPRTVQQVVSTMHEATGQWPRRAGGMLFVPGDEARPGELPPATSMRRLGKVDELFAWMHSVAEIFWADGVKCFDQLDGTSRTSLKRTELFEHMRETLQPAYEAAEALPHYPPAPNTWYAPAKLPKGNRSLITELCDKLNWHTEIDRGLLEAALLTMFWGGSCGTRPAFVLSSQYGAGAGKTTTVGMLTRVCNGHLEMAGGEKPEELAKRLLSDAALRQRAVMLDNVKTKMDMAGLEAMITADEISGHRMYFGHATRPNRLTWFITANSPQLSHDLAERSMNIHIGTQRANARWRAELEEWIDANRPRIIASCLDALAGPDACTIEEHNLDRWASWQAAVLAKVENGNEIAAEMRKRRQAMDSDREDADEIAMVVRGLIKRHGVDPDTVKGFIERRVLVDAVRLWQGDDDDMGRRRTASYINNRVGNGSLKQLRQTKYGGHRGYQWVGEACIDPNEYSVRIVDMPTDFTLEDIRRGDQSDE